jgi:hypothetical protein
MDRPLISAARILLILLLLAPVPSGASTSDRINEVVAGDPLIIYGLSAREAAAAQAGRSLQAALQVGANLDLLVVRGGGTVPIRMEMKVR